MRLKSTQRGCNMYLVKNNNKFSYERLWLPCICTTQLFFFILHSRQTTRTLKDNERKTIPKINPFIRQHGGSDKNIIELDRNKFVFDKHIGARHTLNSSLKRMLQNSIKMENSNAEGKQWVCDHDQMKWRRIILDWIRSESMPTSICQFLGERKNRIDGVHHPGRCGFGKTKNRLSTT